MKLARPASSSRSRCSCALIVGRAVRSAAQGVTTGGIDRRGQGRSGRRRARRHDRRRAPAFGHRPTKPCRRPTAATSSPACASAAPTRSPRTLSGFVTEETHERDAEPRRRPRTSASRSRLATVSETVTVVGESRSGVQLEPHRRRHRGDARRSRHAADDLRPHHRHHAADAAVRRQRHVRRPGQPREQHHRRRLLLQQLVRAGHDHRRHRRPHRRRADLARGDRAGAGERRALRRPSGQLRRRRRQHRDAQRHQPVHRVGLLPATATTRTSAPRRPARPSIPGPSTTKTTGGWVGGPIIKNKLFSFGASRNRMTRPAHALQRQPRRRARGRQRDARAGLRSVARSAAFLTAELQLRHRPVRQHPEGHARPSRG